MSKKRILFTVFSWVFVAFAVVIIAYFALETGEKSSQTSTGVVDTVIEMLPNSENITEPQREVIHISIRQLAHFSIYCMLGFALANAFNTTINSAKIVNVLLAGAFSVQFSLFDEFVLQLNTVGRGAELKDVITDSLGAVLGIVVFSVLYICLSLVIRIFKRKPLK